MYKVCFQEARAEHWQFPQRSEHQDEGENPGEGYTKI